MSIHVLQLGPYPPPEGGVSRNMLAIRDELYRRGDRCSIIATARSASIRDEPDVYHPRSVPELLKLLSTVKFDVLHMHVGGDVTARVLGLAVAAASFARKRSVLTMHSGAFPLTEMARNAKPLTLAGMVFRQFSKIVAVNDELVDVFGRFGVSPKKIEKVLPFALQLPDEQIEIPAELTRFIEEHSPILLSVGGLEKDYDPIFQVGAMRDILRDLPNAGLLMLGNGSLRSEVESAVVSSGYRDNIKIAGSVPHSITLHLIDRADIVLRTTLFDGDAISVRESLFLGTPVVATDNGMRPAGTHLIAMSDVEGLRRMVSSLAGTKRKPTTEKPLRNENIEKILDIYRELL